MPQMALARPNGSSVPFHTAQKILDFQGPTTISMDVQQGKSFPQSAVWTLGYAEFDFFFENKEYRPFDGCKIEI